MRRVFLSTPSARRATRNWLIVVALTFISIHALREEGDNGLFRIGIHLQKFLSTPSARRATSTCNYFTAKGGDFYPRPPRGGRHLLRYRAIWGKKISIHALREEGDHYRRFLRTHRTYFYPRPPRGGRRITRKGRPRITDFYPRPPRGGRPDAAALQGSYGRFLSTPSARRATRAACADNLVQQISIHALREEGDRWPLMLLLFA